MKNIHVLPTDKPSRLYDDGLELYLLIKASNSNNDLISYKNIYITSDEEIKEGDWHLVWLRGKWEVLDYMPSIGYRKECLGKEVCKVILTTDQDLIKDGIQAISTEFLEWFIKNPSCEEVEIKPLLSNNGRALFGYKIIIPKEEPKYSVKKEYVDDQDAYGYDVIVKEKSKQETLEEAAKNYAHKSFIWPLNKQGEKQSIPPGQLVPPGYAKHQKITTKYFINGAKWQQEQEKITTDDAYNEGFENGKHWQQERSYSEEELIEFLKTFDKEFNSGIVERNKGINEWFEQFKKR